MKSLSEDELREKFWMCAGRAFPELDIDALLEHVDDLRDELSVASVAGSTERSWP